MDDLGFMTWKTDFKMLNKIYVMITGDPDVIKVKNILTKMILFIPRFWLQETTSCKPNFFFKKYGSQVNPKLA